MTYRQTKVDKLYNGQVKLLKYYRLPDKTLDYVDIYNSNCKHTSTLTFGSLLNGQGCAHKDCVSETKRKAALKLGKTKKYREDLSKAVKEAFKDPTKRMNQLIGHAKVQRTRRSEYEMTFLGLLALYNIKYVYQKPMLLDNVGCVIDFYLPDYDYYVNINSDIFHWLPLDKLDCSFVKSAQEVRSKDELLRKIFKEKNLNFIELYEYPEMTSFIDGLLKGE